MQQVIINLNILMLKVLFYIHVLLLFIIINHEDRISKCRYHIQLLKHGINIAGIEQVSYPHVSCLRFLSLFDYFLLLFVKIFANFFHQFAQRIVDKASYVFSFICAQGFDDVECFSSGLVCFAFDLGLVIIGEVKV